MNQFSSIFGQILQIFSKRDFYEAVRETKSEKGAKGFTCWGQFVAMLFCQLGQAHSLREICGGLASSLGKLKHLGMEDAPSRSTLSYANEKRPWQLYQNVFYQLLDKCRAVARGRSSASRTNCSASTPPSSNSASRSLTGQPTARRRER